jgi:hypothetical protein
VSLQIRHLATKKGEMARGGKEKPADQMKKRRLPCAIGTNDGASLTLIDF